MSLSLNENNIKSYLEVEYQYTENNLIKRQIADIVPLLQNDYGGINDCALTSITTVMHHFMPSIRSEIIYYTVEEIAKKYFYSSEKGTNPLLINMIFNKVLKKFGFDYQSKSRYLKNVGYNFKTIQQSINIQMPVLLNMTNDGRNYYKNHTVLVIGYLTNGQDIKILIVLDNWSKEIKYIDYNKLSIISSTNSLV